MLGIHNRKSVVVSKTEHSVVWQNMNFLILLVSGMVMAFGSKIYELALPLILYHFTSSPVVMSTMRGIEFLPNLLLAMFIGVIVDRVHKRNWSLWMIILQVVVLLILYGSIQFHQQSIVLFYFCGFFLMTFNYAFFNARMGMVKQSLSTEMLTAANASFNFISTFIGIMGPALTGLILMLSSLHSGLLITALSFLFAFGIILLLKTDEKPLERGQTGFWKDLKDGWIELYRNQTLWLITIMVIFTNSTAGMVDTTIIYFSKDVLKLTDGELGILLSSAGIGGLLGSLVIGKVRKKWSPGVIATVTVLLIGFSYLILFLSSTAIMFSIGLVLNGLFGTIASVSIWTFRQESTPYHLIGRISGITGSIFKLGMPFAIYGAGWISELADPSIVFLVASIGNIFIFFFCRFSLLWNHKKQTLSCRN